MGAGLVVYGGPALIAYAGFGAAGITKGSIAAGAMSMAAKTGVGGALVGTAQSIGAAGLSFTGAAAGGLFGSIVGKVLGDQACNSNKKGCD